MLQALAESGYRCGWRFSHDFPRGEVPTRRRVECWVGNGRILLVASAFDGTLRMEHFDVYCPLDDSNRMDALLAKIAATRTDLAYLLAHGPK